MPAYTYTGVTAEGKSVKGVVEAYDEMEAIAQARTQVRVLSSISEVRQKNGLLSMELTKPRVKPKNLALVCKQIAIVLDAGMAVPRAVSLVADQTTDKLLKKIFADVAADVATGYGLASSLENKGPELPPVFIETVRAGEESGRLAENFERLHGYFDKRSKVAAKVAAALSYPAFVACIAVVVVAVMMIMVIPTILDLVKSLGTEVPAMTQFLIDTATFMGSYWFAFLFVFVVAAIGLNAWARTEQGKTALARLSLKAPVVAPINVNSNAAQFANTMATLLKSGLSAPRAVEVTARVMTNYVISRDVGRMVARLHEGKTLGECLGQVRGLPPTLVEMSAIGEQSGSLEETLETMGSFYDEETERLTEKALSMLEPAMLVVMALFAGFIVIALYLPMFTMYANM